MVNAATANRIPIPGRWRAIGGKQAAGDLSDSVRRQALLLVFGLVLSSVLVLLTMAGFSERSDIDLAASLVRKHWERGLEYRGMHVMVVQARWFDITAVCAFLPIAVPAATTLLQFTSERKAGTGNPGQAVVATIFVSRTWVLAAFVPLIYILGPPSLLQAARSPEAGS